MYNINNKQIIKIKEETDHYYEKSCFDYDLMETLYNNYKKQISIDFPSPRNNQKYVLRSNGYVGYIPINDAYSIHIEPKIKILNIFRMLEYAYNLRSFEFLTGESHIESIQDLYERLASILSKRILEKNKKGLFRDYINHKEDLLYLRGQINTYQSILNLSYGNLKLRCEYEEHTADLVDNQILLWALYQTRKIEFHSKIVKQNVRKAFRELSSKVSLIPIESRQCIRRLYHRLNQDYKPLHGLSRFFIENVGPSIYLGDFKFFPFILNMPSLFELFVAEWLKQNLPSGYYLRKQYRADLDDEGLFNFRIDLVIFNMDDEPLAVLDTKYKYGTDPEQSDISQIIAYAARMDVNHAILVFPTNKTKEIELNPIRGIKVQSIVFDVTEDPERGGKLFRNKMFNKIN